MFDFKEDKLTNEQIINISRADGLPPLRVAINANGYRQAQGFWSDIDTSEVYHGEALAVLIETVTRLAKGSKGVVGVRSLYESARKVKPFCGNVGIMTLIKDTLIPATDKMNVTCLIGDKVYIHPAVMEPSWRYEFKERDGKPAPLPYHLRYTEAEVEEAMEVMRKVKDISDWMNSTNC